MNSNEFQVDCQRTTASPGASPIRAVFVDADTTLAGIAQNLHHDDDPDLSIIRNPDITPDELPDVLAGAQIAIIDHTQLPTDIARRCNELKHVVFLGTGARSYMNPDELAKLGIQVHIIKGYGDIAVAECTMALMWAAARGLARMDREIRKGNWLGVDGIQLTGKTLGLIGFGSIAQEVARMALGFGMKVIAWNRTPKNHPGVQFVEFDYLLANSQVISIHLLYTNETAGFLSRDRINAMSQDTILINTSRGPIIDEDAMVDALQAGHLAHAGLDVFTAEPLPAGHALTKLPNVTLSGHAAFRTAESNNNLIERALAHCRRIAIDGYSGIESPPRRNN